MSAPSFPESDAALATVGGDRCPVCGSQVEGTIDLADFTLYACATCGSWCSDARARGAETTFEPVDYFRNALADTDKWDALRRYLHRAGAPAGSLLDVGCGTGAYLAYDRGHHPDGRRAGIELDPERANRCRENNPDAEIVVGDALAALDAVSGRFDLITLWDVFEHVPDPGQLLDRLATRLNAGGRIYIQTIHEHSIVPALGRFAYRATGGRLRGPARRTHEAHHLVFFSRSGLEGLATRARLRADAIWFDRLARARMDGGAALTLAASLLLAAENALGNGLFINLVLEAMEAGPRG
jgi:2-polyprenyl-3-methyl-5-hydroxy-6-metoxy-1,4-benzoquinol methylase